MQGAKMKRFVAIADCAILLTLALLFLSCASTKGRALIHWDANVKDYKWLPFREIEKGDNVRLFEEALDEKLRQKLLEDLEFSDMKKMLKKTRTQAVIIVQDDKILLEEYGAKNCRDSIVTSFSVAKSINSAMIGVLIDSGKIKSESAPITDYLPELLARDQRFGKITIKNLLNMSSGIVYEETPSRRMDNTETYYNPNLRNLALTNTLIKEDAGRHFLYNNYNPILLGLIIERVTGQSVSEFLSGAIWSKIGCEQNATWSLDSKKDSFEKMESGINTTALDFVRFGCLYRDGGAAGGKQVISKEWIEKSIASENREAEYYSDHWGEDFFSHGVSYGYGWYTLKKNNNSGRAADFFGIGNKGQIVYISPASNMVMVRFGEQNIISLWKWIEAFHDIGNKPRP